MRFNGERQVAAHVTEVWAGLHDRVVLSAAIPGCHDLVATGEGTYAASLQARVGPVSDTYRGRFSIEDLCTGRELRVRVDARGRCGRLQVDLHVTLAPGADGTTHLHYVAEATVGGPASRLGRATLMVTGGHFTGCFFRDLDRSLLRAGAPLVAPVAPGRPRVSAGS
jgi:uncharacterized protein